MGALRTRDLEAALTFVGELNEVDGPEPFMTELLDRLLELVQCELGTYEVVDLATGVVSSYVPCSAEGVTSDTDVPWQFSADVLERCARSPVRAYRRRTGRLDGLVTWSDVVNRGRRVRYEYDEPSQRAWGIVDRACLSLLRSEVRQISLLFDSTNRDFSERDRGLLELLDPHVRAHVRNAQMRRRLAALTAALDAGDEAPAVVLASHDGEIDFASNGARRLLDAYFGEVTERLPGPLLEPANGSMHVAAVRNGTRLIAETVAHDGALLLREEPNVTLTRRERDVLRCIAAGKTTAETARLLWVTEATVSKHLEHVYRKLGVTSRTAALAKLRSSLD